MNNNWTYKKIGDICDIRTGKLDANASSEDGLYPFFTCSKEALRIATYSYDCECVLIAGNGDLNVKYYNGKFDAYQRTYIITVKPSINYISVYYLFVFFSKYVEKLRELSIGGVIKYIKLGNLTEAIIPIPPLQTQSQIVNELDLLQSIIDKQKAQLKELDNLAQAVFYDMFGDPVENEKGWDVKRLEDVCSEIGDGLHGTPQYDTNGTFAFINGNNLIGGKITITDRTQFVNETEAHKIMIAMDTNTVLVSINGTLGKTAIYNNEKIVLGKSACYCRLKDFLFAKFVLSLMNTEKFQLFLENNSSKSTIKNVGLKAIRNYKMIIPPLSLQQSFAAKIELIEKQKTAIGKSIEETQKLFDYTMDKYFG